MCVYVFVNQALKVESTFVIDVLIKRIWLYVLWMSYIQLVVTSFLIFHDHTWDPMSILIIIDTKLTYKYEIHFECNSTLTTLANILFVEILKFIYICKIFFVKKNEKYFGMFWNIQILKMKSKK
jgi:hypothetical protein